MGRQGVRRRVAKGLYRDGSGLAAVVHANGYRRELRFPATTPLRTVRAAADELRAQLRKLPRSQRHTLADDAQRYLTLVQPELVTARERAHLLGLWLPRFGHLRTTALAQHVPALNEQLRAWRRTAAASTCNHRRNALTNCIRLLYGKRAALDLVDLVRFKEPPSRARWLPRKRIEAVLEVLPAGKTKVRLWLMHWTGMRPSQMGRLTDGDFHLDDAIPFVVIPRGKGGLPATVPLTPSGLDAARAFLEAEAFHPWSCSSANKLLSVAARRVGVEPFTVYQIRHSFATALRHTGADVSDIQDLFGHTDAATSEIYARSSLAKHRDAIARLEPDENVAPIRGTRSEMAVSY